MGKQINLNADMGESFGAYQMGDDAALMAHVNSANIACGFHAGDPRVMGETVKSAIAHDVSMGAHPSFADLQGFGRRAMQLSDQEVHDLVLYQIGALAAFAQSKGEKLSHVKPHGALNNMACEDENLAGVICGATQEFSTDLIMLAPALSALSRAAKKTGLPVAEEIFADRAYTDQGTLVSRKEAGAVIHDAQICLKRVRDMLEAGGLITQAGHVLETPIHSICVHGDTPGAIETARQIAKGLSQDGYDLIRLDQMTLA